MNSKVVCIGFIGVVLMLGVQTASAQETQPSSAMGSCRAFVQAFYDWYVERTNSELHDPRHAQSPDVIALKVKAGMFSQTLYAALKKDEDAQARSRLINGVTGDFDVFLATNGLIPKRVVVESRSAGTNRCLASVYDLDGNKRSTKPRIVAELLAKGRSWQFNNFYYGHDQHT